jgi:hypothetical protein
VQIGKYEPLLTTSLPLGLLLSGFTMIPHLDSTSWIASTAVASVVAAALSSWFNYLLKNKEYKNDYYKKVIDKRIKALESVEVLVSLFFGYARTPDGMLF